MGIGIDLSDTGVSTSTTTKHLLPGGLTVIVADGRVRSWNYTDQYRNVRQALERCGQRRFKRRSAQLHHMRLLHDLCVDLQRGHKRDVAPYLESDVADVMEAFALDGLRRTEMEDRVLAFASLLPTTTAGA